MTTTSGLCSPCYWAECLDKTESCLDELCICRCRPRRPVSDSTNVFVRKALGRELRAYAYRETNASTSYVGLLRAARLIEDGEI